MGRTNEVERRKKAIKELLSKLHAGETVDDVKQESEEAFKGVSATEISEAEQALIAEGMPVHEIQRLCDVHAAVFKGSIEEIHAPVDPSNTPGHPASTLKAENRAIERLIEGRIRPKLKAVSEGSKKPSELSEGIASLQEIDVHYSRKENIIFPYLERYGITAPPKVMWGVDDEIRAALKEAASLAQSGDMAVVDKLEWVLTAIKEMIFKEENILLPMMVDTLKQQDWVNIADQSVDLGYCLIETPAPWHASQVDSAKKAERPEEGVVRMPTGFLSHEELTHMLNTLPIDITFVGKDDTVRYFSESPERIFARAKAIVGRKVTNCHPPASVHVVEDIVNDLKSGKKSHEDFWIRMGDRYILIRYFAVRDEKGEYLGVLEVSQDIAPIQKITGQKRLLDD